MSVRNQGKNILGKVLSIEKNRDIIETQIWKNNKDDFTEEKYKNDIYQTAGLILKNKKDIRGVLSSLKEKKTGWDSAIFANVKSKIKEHDEFLEKPFEVSLGVVKCKCGSERVYSIPMQTRSCDEATSTKCTCAECGKQWVQNNS